MRKLVIPLILIGTMLLLASCDQIDPPYIDGNGSLPVDTTECPIPSFPVDTHHVKVVLIEEYTGHTCVNCPSAAVIAHGIENTYNEKVILMAIHAGYFAQIEGEGPNYSLDLRNTCGTELHSYFGITNNPAAIFNRKYINGSRIFEASTAWEATFIDAQDTIPVLDMQIINTYTETENKVCIHVQTEYLVDLDKNLKIAVYVVEDSIVGYQKNNNAVVGVTPEIPDYVFMHVLRRSVNDTWGSDLSSGEIAAGTKKISSFKFILDSSWDHDNCHIIAVVYDADTDEILMSAEEKVEQ